MDHFNKDEAKVLILRPPFGEGAVKGRNTVRDFIYGCWCNGRRIGGMKMPPLTELYIATVLKQNSFPTVFLDAELQPEQYGRIAADGFRNIGIVALMVSTQSFIHDVEFLKFVKQSNKNCKTILFGSHPTFMPSYCLSKDVVDYIVLGEVEETILELVKSIYNGQPMDGILGIGYRDADGNPHVNPSRPFMDLDDLPIPDRTLLPENTDYFNPVVKRMPYTTALTSRGCPFNCIFCTAPHFHGRKPRVRSAQNVLNELRILISLGYREVFFRDETFAAYSKRNKLIFETMIAEKMDLTWIANSRVDTIDLETMQLMKRAGCHMLKFGIETGNDELLKTYKKGTTVAQAERAIAMTKQVGLETHTHIIFGGPGETPETIEKTIRFAVKCNPTTASFGILTPYPGSELFDRVAKDHPEIQDGSDSNMTNLHTTGFYSETICGLSGEYLSKQITRAYRRFYLRPRYLLGMLLRVTSLSGFFRLAIAGSNILKFALTGEK